MVYFCFGDFAVTPPRELEAATGDGAGTGYNILFIQYGDFGDAWVRLSSGKEETYQAQRASVEFVADLAKRNAVTVICVRTDAQSDVVLDCGIRAIGLGPDGNLTGWHGWSQMIRQIQPDRIVLRTPLLPVLEAVKREPVPTLLTLADSFQGNRLRQRIDRWRLKRLLQAECFQWVANHGLRATFGLAALGVSPSQAIPWDWPPRDKPHLHPPKSAISRETPELVFVGALSVEKGAYDLLEAVGQLAERGRMLKLRIVGPGDAQALKARAEALGVAAHVHFEGVVENRRVGELMRQADIVAVPSRHNYPEGLPLTIYEAFCSRTPLIVSDHPMFEGNVVQGFSGLVFPEKNVAGLSAQIERMIEDPALYADLSRNSEAAWERLQLPVTWMELVSRWLSASDTDHAWLSAHSVASGIYEARA